MDVVSNVLTWSDEEYRVFGLTHQEFGGTYEAFLQCVHPDDREAVDAAYSGSIRDNKDSYEIEHRVVWPDGEIRFVHEKCEHIKNAFGKVIRSVGMTHDITEKKQVEKALRRANDELENRVEERTEELARSNLELTAEIEHRRRVESELRLHEVIVSNMAEGVAVVRMSDLAFLYVNPKLESILGYEPGELIGRQVAVINYEDERNDPQRTAEEIARQLKAHGEATYEVINVKKDGTPIWSRATTSIMKHPLHGTIAISVKEDITEHRQIEDALKESEQKLGTIVENSLTGLCIIQDGRIVFANPRFAEIYGYSLNEIVGMESLDLVHPDDLELVRRYRKARLAGEEAPLEYETRGLTKQGDIVWVMRRNRLISHDGKPAILGNIADITRQKRTAEQAERTMIRLRALIRATARCPGKRA